MAVRNERVLLSLQDDFSGGMAKAAAATALLNRELKNLDGASVKADRSTQAFTNDLQGLTREANGADRSINQLTGRLRLFADAAAIFGPGTVPLGGVLAAGVAGFASQLGFAAVAGGVLVGSMQGLGDALGAMNKAQLEPTNKNLQKAKEALERLSPAAKEFAESAFALKPALVALRDIGSEALFPGLTESLDSLERLGPKVAGIFQEVASAAGEIAADSSASLASGRWADFFAFIEAEAPDAITELATTVGDLTHGMAELWEAFTPLNDGFSSWLMGVADGFDEWATGLSATDGFAEFVDYIQTTGPQVADTLGALGSALVQIVQATAPLGGPVLASLEAVAKVIGSIADSDLGTPIFAGVAALALLNRSLAVTAALSKTSMSGGMFASLGTASGGIKKQAGSIRSDIADMSDSLVAFGSNADKAGAAADRMKGRLAAGAGLAGLGVIATGAADGIGLTNTASLALMGTLGGPPGVAIGAAAGALMDLRTAGMGATEAIQGLDAAVASGDMGALSNQIAAAKAELADLTNLDFGTDIFEQIGFSVADTFGGPSMDDARKKIQGAEKALEDLAWAEKKAEIEAKGAALAFLTQTGANVDLGKWSRKSTEQIKAQADALLETRKSADETARSFVGLGDSLNDGKKSLGDWIKDMASTADALNNFTTNSQRAAKRGLDYGLISSLQAAGKEGALRMRQLANGTEAEIDRANAAFRKGEKAIERYNNYKVPPKKVTADTSRAMQSFREVDQYLSGLNGTTATTYVNTVRTITGPMGGAAFSQKADGGSVPKTGRPYADRHPYLLADGEEVVSNRRGQSDRFRPVLKAINADVPRSIIKGMLAEGGTAYGGAGENPDLKKRAEEARRRAEERRQRAEERRQRQLEKQRVKDLLKSDLRDEQEQARLEVADARRRLKSAKGADRPKSEVREARLALKSELTDVAAMRADALQERQQKQVDAREERERKQAEAREKHDAEVQARVDAILDGQQRAWDIVTDSARSNVDAAKSVLDGVNASMEQIGKAATGSFQSNWFAGGGQQQRGLWVGANTGPAGDWRSQALNDIRGLGERKDLIGQLSGQGLTGAALENLLGNQTNEGISAMLQGGQIADYAALFAQRESLTTQTAAAAGQAGYGGAQAAAAAGLAAVSQILASLTAAIEAQRTQNFTINESVSAAATAAEVARLQAMYGVS